MPFFDVQIDIRRGAFSEWHRERDAPFFRTRHPNFGVFPLATRPSLWLKMGRDLKNLLYELRFLPPITRTHVTSFVFRKQFTMKLGEVRELTKDLSIPLSKITLERIVIPLSSPTNFYLASVFLENVALCKTKIMSFDLEPSKYMTSKVNTLLKVAIQSELETIYLNIPFDISMKNLSVFIEYSKSILKILKTTATTTHIALCCTGYEDIGLVDLFIENNIVSANVKMIGLKNDLNYLLLIFKLSGLVRNIISGKNGLNYLLSIFNLSGLVDNTIPGEVTIDNDILFVKDCYHPLHVRKYFSSFSGNLSNSLTSFTIEASTKTAEPSLLQLLISLQTHQVQKMKLEMRLVLVEPPSQRLMWILSSILKYYNGSGWFNTVSIEIGVSEMSRLGAWRSLLLFDPVWLSLWRFYEYEFAHQILHNNCYTILYFMRSHRLFVNVLTTLEEAIEFLKLNEIRNLFRKRMHHS